MNSSNNSKNIQDYVINQVIKKLQKENGELETLRDENDKLKGIIDNFPVCSYCYTDIDVYQCASCRKKMCFDCAYPHVCK